MNKLLEEGIGRLGLEVTGDQLEKMGIFISEIALFNPAYRLVSYEDEDELVIRHFLDCLAGVPVIARNLPEGGTIADLGSGAGFPGVLLAIMFPEHKVYLVERMARRAGFLKNVLLRCNLKSAEVVSLDVKDVSDRFDLVTCRAFHPLPDIISDAGRIMKDDGVLCAYKGRRDYVEAELELISGYESTLDRVKVPFLDETRFICTLRRK